MSGPETDVTAIIAILCAVALPVILGFGIAAFTMVARQRQLKMILRERELLIEKGITDLPPLKLPGAEKQGNGHGNLKWGLILVFIAAAAVTTFLLSPSAAQFDQNTHRIGPGTEWLLYFATFSGAIGLALIAFHFIARAYRKQDVETSKPEAEA